MSNSVKVWLFNDEPGGRVFMWPTGYEGDDKYMTWRQEIVGHNMAIPDTIRPALEMSRPIWEAFRDALLENTHLRVDALDIVAKTLEREQTRVDILIQALIRPPTPLFELQSDPVPVKEWQQ